LSAHSSIRLRLALAFLLVALAGTAVGASVLLGSNQEDPVETAEEAGDQLHVTGPPLVPETPVTDAPVVAADDPTMRLGVLDKDAARQEERRARADAEALRILVAQQAAAYEFAAALADADAAAAEPGPTTAPAPTTAPDPTPAPGGGGGGGGNRPPPPPPNNDDDPFYVKLDNIATCESGRNPRAYNPNGPYWGAFQFHVDTWASHGGGGSGTPRQRGEYILDRSYNQQREIAANLARARGFAGSWPTCAARYGYT